ncbi:hypothetical protein ACXET9_02895 [Brachybacterium sp. DNPG3]
MTDGESASQPARRRPSYGLPGPTPDPAAPGQDPFAGPGADGSAAPDQQGAWGAPASPYGAYSQGPAPQGSGAPYGSASEAPAVGPTGGALAGPAGGAFGGPAGAPAPPRRRRRGLVPLIIGLVLLLIIAPLFAVGGIVWSFSSLVGDASAGPEPLSGATSEIELPANEMLLIYVPAEDSAAGAVCTAAASDGSASLSVVDLSGTTQFGDGTVYEQEIGVAALEDTTVTITCEGTDSPAYLGPYNLLGSAAPMLVGPLIGVVAGLVGLILTIVGIVGLVRSRRR